MELLELALLAIASAFWPVLIAVDLIALRTPRPATVLGWFLAGGLLTTIGEGHAQVVPVAVDECDASSGRLDCERGSHERVRRAEHGPPPYLEVAQRGQRCARPAGGGDGREPVPLAPGGFERVGERSARPLLPLEDPVPECVQPLTVAVIEPDCEGVD